jgi:hypothetical protein
MSRIVELPVTKDGPIMRIEVDDTTIGSGPRVRGGSPPVQGLIDAGKTFEDVVDGIKPSILVLFEQLQSRSQRNF